MPVDTASVFSQVIDEHIELKRRNAELEPTLPIDRYVNGDPFENHPLFKTEEQARIEETTGRQRAGRRRARCGAVACRGRAVSRRGRRLPVGPLARLRLGRLSRLSSCAGRSAREQS